MALANDQEWKSNELFKYWLHSMIEQAVRETPHPEQLVTGQLESEQFESEHEAVEAAISRVRARVPGAVSELIELAYQRLHRIAARLVGRTYGPTPTLHATALVNESLLRLYGKDHFSDLTCAKHFYALFSTATQHALIDYQRYRMAEKRGGNFHRLPLELVLDQLLDQGIDPVELKDELDTLRATDAQCAQVVEMFYFSQLTVPEIAKVLCVSISTVESDLRIGRAFLRRLALEEEAA